MRNGIRLGIDVGTSRIGVARSDPSGLLAVPLETIPRVFVETNPETPAVSADLLRIAELVAEFEVFEIIVGMPLALSGASTASTRDAEAFAQALCVIGVTVRLVDERLSTVSATRNLRDAGKPSKTHRGFVDQAAAVIILQQALDSERSSTRPPGHLIS